MASPRFWIVAWALACALGLAPDGRADMQRHSNVAATDVPALEALVHDALSVDVFDLQKLEVPEVAPEALEVTVRLPNQQVTLSLTRRSLRTDYFQLLVQTDAQGTLTPTEAPPVLTYNGTVQQMPGARVAASLWNGGMRAIIRDGEQSYTVEPLADLGIDPQARWHAVYNATDVRDAGGSCGVENDKYAHIRELVAAGNAEREAAGTTATRVAILGIDADHNFYLEAGGSTVAGTVAEVESLMNAIRQDYEAGNVGLTWEVSTIIVREDINDPYTSNNSGALLGQLDDTWNSAPENAIPRDTFKLFHGINISGSIIGEANCIGCGCSTSNAYCHAESTYTSNFTLRVSLSSHELGHVWGAFHCDGCGSCSQCCRIMCSGNGGCNSPVFFGCEEAADLFGYIGFASCDDPQQLPLATPFCEEWASPVIDVNRWTYNKGAIPSSSASNPPSPSFVIELDASGSGDYQDDELRSNIVDLSGLIDTVLSYQTQHQGVSLNEMLVVEYWAFNNVWVELNTIVSNGVDETQFVYHEHVLPPQAQHNEFRMRFRTLVSGPGDNWFIDDISLDCFPPPVCEEPCNDGNACTVSDNCVGEFQCAGNAVDCSGASGECSVASCALNGPNGNCNIVTSSNEGGACSGATGFCSAGGCVSASTTKRLFMTGDGQQNAAPEGGPTAVILPAGGTRRIAVFMEDNRPAGSSTNGYQVMISSAATPVSGATGTVSYLDNNPGSGGGNSVVIDTLRNDWVYGNEPVTLTPTYNETPAQGYFGVQYTTIPGTGVDTAGDGVLYLAEFDLQASANASGQFQLEFKLDAAPLTSLFNPFGAPLPLDQPQALLITIGDVDCLNASDCGDLDSNGVRDDPCLFYACAGGACQTLNRDAGQADMGGFAGTCQIDGACDINDKFHAQNCFGNQDTDASPGYPCEQENPDYPPNALNVDAVGFAGTCVLDGVCDINDAFASENCFANVGTQGSAPFPCSCNGPLPQAPQQAVRPQALSKTGLTLRGPRSARPGTLIDIDVYADQALKALRGYQLHLAATGGAATGGAATGGGSLELVDITVDDQRRGYVFGDADQPAWMTFNTATRQMLAGVSPEGVSTPASGYLATFTYRVPDDADGTFVIDVLHDELNPRPTGRTFLFATPYEPIGIDGVRPAIVQVHGARTRAAR